MVKPKRRLMFQLIVLLLLIALVPLMISDTNLVRINEEYLENDLLDSHTKLAWQTAEEVSGHLRNTVEKLEIIARLQPLIRSFTDIQKYQLLFFFLEEYPDLISITLMDPKGKVWAEVVRPELSAINLEAREKTRTKVFEEAFEGNVFIADPMGIPEKELSILTIGLPIISGNHVGGVLLADMSMEKIWRIVERISIRRFGEAYLVDRRGRLIAHRERARALRQEEMQDVEIVGKYLVLGKTGGALPFVDKSGREMLGAYAPLDLEGWGVVVQEPRQDAYIVVAEMKRQILVWGVCTGILVSVIGVWLARRISVPITDFTRSALRIAKGNFNEKITVGARNEIGQLAETFNYMVKQLNRYDKNMRRLFMSAIASLAAAIDERDPYTRGHSDRVTQYSLSIADEMGLPPKTREVLHFAALLHDVGKIGIDDGVLRKPTALTKEEFDLIKQHPAKGATIMAPIQQLKKIIPSMRHHHERYDGEGYPDGLKGEEIPLQARIITVADTFDAMSSDRPYQVAMPETHVVNQIEAWAGSRFDPEVIKAFVAAYGKNKIIGLKRQLAEEGAVLEESVPVTPQSV
jgi:putative nucleotidyltransferase with HDIG domain